MGEAKGTVQFTHDGAQPTGVGYRRSTFKTVLFVIGSVLSVSLLYIAYVILGYWKPRWKLLVIHSRCSLADATLILVEDEKDFHPCKIKRMYFEQSEGRADALFNKLGELTDAGIIRLFNYKMDTFALHEQTVQHVSGLGLGHQFKDLLEFKQGWSQNSANILKTVYGSNSLDVPLDPLFKFVLTEVLTFFYLFQIFSCTIWYMNNYEVFATLIVVMSAVSCSSTVYLTRKTRLKLRKAVKFECPVSVLRDGKVLVVKSGDLVPGDIVQLPKEEFILPFDGILIEGNVIVNEAMLTGESVPTFKNPIPHDDLESVYNAQSIYTLYSGTTVVQTRPPASGQVHCLVTQTGFLTKKGEYVKFMLYPKTKKFKFYSEAYTYIKIMGFIGVLGMVYTIWNGVAEKRGAGDVLLKSLDLITIIIAPSLPLALSISVFYAIRRLKQSHIKCATPNSINIAGKIKMCVFDKTGTLTEEGLMLHSVVTTLNNTLSEVELSKEVKACLACCHSISLINDKLCGDPLDIIGLERSGFTFNDVDVSSEGYNYTVSSTLQQEKAFGDAFGVVKIYPFESELKRMSTVCEEQGGGLWVFCKGAPEQIIKHCNANTLPVDFESQLAMFTNKGYRVIGLSCKQLPEGTDLKELDRNGLESELTFIGLLVLTNQLKEVTPSVIHELQRAAVSCVMCTGDNLLTALCVATECDLIPYGSQVTIVQAKESAEGVQVTQEVHSANTGNGIDDGISEVNEYKGPMRRQHFAIDGASFSLLLSSDKHKDLVDKVCVLGSVFARFSPDEKMFLVDELIQRDYTVCMCGDGANDCEALKQAHVGIALSKCEASLAAPFTSSVFDISCVPKLLKEGQGALENSMAVFKFTAMYSIIQYVSVILLVKYSSVLGDYQYLFEDIGIVLLFDFTVAYTRPARLLCAKRPHGSLMHPYVLYSFIMQTGIAALFMWLAITFVQRQPWYDPLLAERKEAITNESRKVDIYETTANFWISCFQYIIVALVFSIGRPYRLPTWSNVPNVISVILATALCLMTIFVPSKYIPALELVDIQDLEFKFYILGLALLNLALAYQVELSYRYIKPLQKFLKWLRFCKKETKRHNIIIELLTEEGVKN